MHLCVVHLTCLQHRNVWERKFLHWPLRGKAKVMQLLHHCQNSFPHPLLFFALLSLLAGPALFSLSPWGWLTKPSLLPISSETGAGTMTASSLAERGRGKRGPWELKADTLRAVQVSSSPGLAEKRRLICCPCFPREGGCRRKEEDEERGIGVVSEQGRMSQARGGCLPVFKTDRQISVSSGFLLPMGGNPPFSPHPFISSCFFYSPAISLCVQKQWRVMASWLQDVSM